MEQLLPVYLISLSIFFGFVLLRLLRSDEARSNKLAKIRVRIDDPQRSRALPPEEEGENPPTAEFLILATLVLIILMVIKFSV